MKLFAIQSVLTQQIGIAMALFPVNNGDGEVAGLTGSRSRPGTRYVLFVSNPYSVNP